ncbi:allantoate amidohydrolase [Rothia sp. BD8]|uniref:allantoate amidohydrolase n=1 Tax=Rothia TaxID=32207 RepID=UPI0018CB8A95|nr:allantoate amidohydrolase [Rothia kristinae]
MTHHGPSSTARDLGTSAQARSQDWAEDWTRDRRTFGPLTQDLLSQETSGRRLLIGTDLYGEAPESPARRVLNRCAEIARISARPHGIERTYLTPQHQQHNALAARWMRGAGLRTWVDAAGTLHGRLEAPEQAPGVPVRILYLGSHLDTVPDAGKYDGILGVVSAIEVVSRFRRQAARLPFSLEVLAFGDEEGVRFGATLLGSRALAGTWDDAWLELADEHGTTMHQAFLDFGLDPQAVGSAALNPEQAVGYLETHIEQGPLLQEADRPLSVVTSISGARRFRITVTGEAAHAGGTPYARRRDALIGASRAVLAINAVGLAQDVVATVGELSVIGGAVNVVPGTVEFSLDLRAPDDLSRDTAFETIRAELEILCAEADLGLNIEQTHSAPGAVCDERLMGAVRHGIAAAEQRAGGPAETAPMELYSKAGHDAMALAEAVPVAMVFVRCLDGISHHPGESVRPDDVALALDAVEEAVLELARQETSAAGVVPGPTAG